MTFWLAVSPNEQEWVQSQLDEFSSSTGIEVDVSWLIDTELPSGLATASAAGTPPDLVGLWLTQFSQLQELFSPISDINPDFSLAPYTPSARLAATLNETPYALPWTQDLCIPNFRLLAIPKGAAQPEIAYKLAAFLVEQERQQANYDKLQTWYPTLSELYFSRGGPGCPKEQDPTVVVEPTEEERSEIIAAVQQPMTDLESVLKDNGNWPESQPTTLNFPATTGAVLPYEEGQAAAGQSASEQCGKTGCVAFGVTPVKFGSQGVSDGGKLRLAQNTPVLVSFRAEDLEAYSKDHPGEGVIIGAVQVFDESVFSPPIPAGTYAAAWTSSDKPRCTVTTSGTFYLLTADGTPQCIGQVSSLVGENVDPSVGPDFAEPVAIAEEGSWWFSFLFDRRRGRAP